ncbi:hypothetical protein SNE40_000540 [Patella caerulea]|uniref:Methyltransferase domain-containing protein n=1 Tax=Patella caerulea TaxID=87958 RepID=A0AAN8KEW2_PATCE
MSELEIVQVTAQSGYDSISLGGIFRGARAKQTAKMVEKAQICLADFDFKSAKSILTETSEFCTDLHDQDYLQWVLAEITKYEEQKIPLNCRSSREIDWSSIQSRPLKKISERFQDLPQSFIIIRVESNHHGVQFFVGRKLLSELYRNAQISELHCSLVTANMLLGCLEDLRITQNAANIFYRPFKHEEKMKIMRNMIDNMANVEITYPFPMLRPDTKEELVCPTEGWDVDEDFAEQLEAGEVILWQYSLEFLRSLGSENLRVYDPACSNGQFLENMKAGMPHGYFIGQDLNPSMVKYTKNRIDEVHCGNCMIPRVDKESVDVAFFRFLNSEIVKTDDVIPLLTAVGDVIKPGGHMVIFGHTPVLLSSSELKMLPGWRVLQSVGGGKKWKGIFQFYVIKKDLC